MTTKHSTTGRFIFSMIIIIIGAILGQLNYAETSENNEAFYQEAAK